MRRQKAWIFRRYSIPYRLERQEALTEANMSNLNLDVLSQVLANYELLQAEGCGDLGTQALIKYYEEEMDV